MATMARWGSQSLTISTKKIRPFDGFSTAAEIKDKDSKSKKKGLELEGVKECRRSALQALHNEINHRYPNRTIPKSYFQELLAHFSEQSEMKQPYCGILIDWLNKKI